MGKIIITTNNSDYNIDGKCIGGYNEIHSIKRLSSEEHLIETVKSIIQLNITYTKSKLDDIIISLPFSCPYNILNIQQALQDICEEHNISVY